MELTQKILDFYDAMLDGDGLAKMIFKAGRKGVPSEKIKLAAQEVYYQHLSGDKVEPLTVARKVFRIARDGIIREQQVYERGLARDMDSLLKYIEELERKIVPFRTKLYHWWPNWIYFM